MTASRARWAAIRARVPLVVVSLIVTAMVVTACGSAGTEQITVAATIFPVYDIVRQVAGLAADVVLVLPPGASPHIFEPTPTAVRALAGARALFVVGHGLDAWAVRLAQGAGVARLVPVDAGIALRRAAPRGRVDAHYWLSARNAMTIARTVSLELLRLAPDRRAEIEAALAAYLARLEAVDDEVRRLLADLSARKIATFHVSWHGLAAIGAVTLLVAVVLARVGRRLVFATFDPEGAHAAGIDVGRLLTAHHVLLALAVIGWATATSTAAATSALAERDLRIVRHEQDVREVDLLDLP